ncbi:hypothetical protein J19TS2_18350 [Cohnella xylanilytica]|uniref:DUF6470 family protein n=1 Tax=Cohnella xylanilytica TaxID=557555 RepID=UPI001B1419F2|nr:DUF6470 family protein [Cohnella xylanilytica]GIO12280.1 hypothetical protein J19TS2_18350 [Cohnella xylanilytica]
MSTPFLSIQSQRGLISVESEPARLDIHRTPPDIQVESTDPVVEAHNAPGELVIDQTDSWNALNGGKPEAFWQRIYSQYKEIALQNLQKIVEDGNRVGDLRDRVNPIPEMALEEFVEGAPDLQVYGPATADNVDIQYIPNDVNLTVVRPGDVRVDVQTHPLKIAYHPGKVTVSVQQYPKVTITPPPPRIDTLA